MIIAVDFDGTVVSENRRFDDLSTPLELIRDAEIGLRSLRRAHHALLLYSARSNRARRVDPYLDPLALAGVYSVDRDAWEQLQPLYVARFTQMVRFVNERLPGLFDAIDDGIQGKPVVDLFIDNRVLRFHADGRRRAQGWREIAAEYGAPDGTAVQHI